MKEKPYKDDDLYLFASFGDAAWSRVVRGSELLDCVVEALVGAQEGSRELRQIVEGAVESLHTPEDWAGPAGVEYWPLDIEDGGLGIVRISEELRRCLVVPGAP